jgi:hypothetical protein
MPPLIEWEWLVRISDVGGGPTGVTEKEFRDGRRRSP